MYVSVCVCVASRAVIEVINTLINKVKSGLLPPCCPGYGIVQRRGRMMISQNSPQTLPPPPLLTNHFAGWKADVRRMLAHNRARLHRAHLGSQSSGPVQYLGVDGCRFNVYTDARWQDCLCVRMCTCDGFALLSDRRRIAFLATGYRTKSQDPYQGVHPAA